MLYEPTNIIPSAMTQTGTVASAENVNIQWQVNGNSAMTMFQIDVMQNNADSTFVCSSGVVTENPTVAQGYSLPFYGKDRFGNYVQFVYQPNQTWGAWSGNTISDGNSYKFRITQFFQESGTACKVPITSNLSAGTTYYFSYSVNGVTQFVSFIVANAAYFVSGNTIYFNFTHNAGWVVTSGNNSRVITDITFSVFATQPSGTLLSGAVAVSSGDTFYNQFFTVQNSASSFITRTEPTLAITPLTTTPVASATQSFTASYSQAQGDSINTVRWQLFNADDMSAPIDDTGDISTSVLFYEYNGLFDGQSYTVICTITTESGVSVSAELSFSVQYEQETYTGDFSVIPICQENSNLLQWDSVENIPGVNTPDGTALVQDGQLILPENATVAWSQKTDENGELQPINFEQPWTTIWKGTVAQPKAEALQKLSRASLSYGLISAFNTEELSYPEEYIWHFANAMNPAGTLMVLENAIYSITNSGITFIGKLTDGNGDELEVLPTCASFSPNGNLLVVGGNFGIDNSRSAIYRVIGQQFEYVGTISGVSCNTDPKMICFSDDGTRVLFGGDDSSESSSGNNVWVCSISLESEISALSFLEYNNTALLHVKDAVFSLSSSKRYLYVVGGISQEGFAYIYQENEETFEYVATITTETRALEQISINPNNGALVLCIGYSDLVVSYAVSDLIVTRQSAVSGGHYVYITQDGRWLFICQETRIAVYKFIGAELTEETNIDTIDNYSSVWIAYSIQTQKSIITYTDTNSYSSTSYGEIWDISTEYLPLDGDVLCSAFSPQGNYLVVGGNFTEKAVFYSVVGEDLYYITDLKYYGGQGNIDGNVYSVAFSADGNGFVIGGAFSRYAWKYVIEEGVPKFDNVIYKDALHGEELNGTVYALSYNTVKDILIVGGGFDGKASLFSGFSTGISMPSYVSDIVANSSALDGDVSTIAINNQGTAFVLGGNFTGKAAFFDINASAASFVAYLTKNGESLNGMVSAAAFSENGVCVAIGGIFEGYAALFSVENGTPVYLSNVLRGINALDGKVNAISFSDDGKTLLLGGEFSNGVSVFSVNTESQEAIYICDLIDIDDSTLSSVFNLTFNQSGTLLVSSLTLYLWESPSSFTIEEIFHISGSSFYLSRNGQKISVYTGEILIGQVNILANHEGGINTIIIAISPTECTVYCFYKEDYIGQNTIALSYVQQNISSVFLQGKQECDYFAVVDGDGSNILTDLSDPSFSPSWNSEQYTLDLFANFITGIDGGTGTGAGTGFRIYRRTADGKENIEIITLPSTIYKVKDYGIKSNESYIYDFYVYDANGAFMGVKSTEQSPLKRQFNRFSLLSTQYNESDNCYHVVKEYQFSCNIQDMTVSNNSNKSYAQNFTPYPTVFQSTANYASGTLQALIGFVDPKVYKYWDSTQLMDELNALSTTTNTLFLKDMKGHLWMVDVGTVQMTATQKTREMQVTISLPWAEIGDASDVSIIQTPDDEGWNSGVEVLDVRLDVDVTTGVLRVSYPFPYNGTSFYLVGSTPVGSENVVNPLPSVASNPQDGVLTANKK